jgi:methylmalonyl-CoA carboxyltransferase large subunit
LRRDTAVIDTEETTMRGSVPESESAALRATLEDIRSQLAKLSERVAGLEQLASMSGSESVPVAVARPVEIPTPAAAPATPTTATTSTLAEAAGISEEEVLAISAALAAWLGVQAHIRQIRLIRTGAWAQQGRVTIQASHRLNH